MAKGAPLLTYEAVIRVDGVAVKITVNPRCRACRNHLGDHLAHPYSLSCSRCGALNQVGSLPHAIPAPESVRSLRWQQ